jgi:HEAT repeat protein
MSRSLLIGLGLAAAVCLVIGCGKQSPPAVMPPVVREKPAAQTTPAEPAQSTAEVDTPRPMSPPALDDLRKTLSTTDDSRTRVLTLDEIATFGSRAKDALPEILAMTGDPEPRVRWHAARTIGLIGEDAIPAIPTLIKLLEDDDPITVAQAAAAIRHIHADDDRTDTPQKDAAVYQSAVEPLIAATVHPDARVRRAAIRTVRVLDADSTTLAALLATVLADSEPTVILPALHTLADMGDEAVPVLIEALKVPKARYWAAVALAEIGAEAAPAVEGLTTLAVAGDSEERMQAMLALAAIGPPAASAAPVLVEALSSRDGSLRFAAVFALGSLQAKAADAALQTAADDPDDFLAEIAAWARAKIHPDDIELRERALKKLRGGLASELPKVRAASTSGLSDIAQLVDAAERRRLAGDFITMLSDPDPGVGTRGGAALIRLGGDAVEPLSGQLADPGMRLATLEILAAIGGDSVAALDQITDSLSADDPFVRGEAAIVLAAIGPPAAPAVPHLQEILANDSEAPGTRYSAAYALGRIGPAAAPALDTLRSLADANDELMATVAVWAALKIEPGNTHFFETAMPRLRKALRAESDLARLEAAVALGEIGPHAKTAVPILQVVEEDDPVRAVRAAAAEALQKIGG